MAPDGYYVPRILFVGKCSLYEKVHISVRVESGVTDLNSGEFLNRCAVCLSADPSMTVRTDITGRYSNHLYTYEPKDMSNCE